MASLDPTSLAMKFELRFKWISELVFLRPSAILRKSSFCNAQSERERCWSAKLSAINVAIVPTITPLIELDLRSRYFNLQVVLTAPNTSLKPLFCKLQLDKFKYCKLVLLWITSATDLAALSDITLKLRSRCFNEFLTLPNTSIIWVSSKEQLDKERLCKQEEWLRKFVMHTEVPIWLPLKLNALKFTQLTKNICTISVCLRQLYEKSKFSTLLLAKTRATSRPVEVKVLWLKSRTFKDLNLTNAEIRALIPLYCNEQLLM